MVRLREIGIICITTELQGICQGCLWLEWDPGRQRCLNRFGPLCTCRQNDARETPSSESPAFKITQAPLRITHLP